LTVKRFSGKGKEIDGGDSGESRSKLSGKEKFLGNLLFLLFFNKKKQLCRSHNRQVRKKFMNF